MRRDDVLEIDVRLILETDDKHQIYMTWKGFRHGPKEVIDRLNRGEDVDPETYYFLDQIRAVAVSGGPSPLARARAGPALDAGAEPPQPPATV